MADALAVWSFDACTGDRPCPHCAAGRPEAPDELPDPADTDSAWELDDAIRYALPPAYHRPRYLDTCTPKIWVCAVCWDESQVSSWPCHVADRHGAYVQRSLDAERRILAAASHA